MLLLLPSGATAFRLSIVVAAAGVRVTVQRRFPYVPLRESKYFGSRFFCAVKLELRFVLILPSNLHAAENNNGKSKNDAFPNCTAQ